jgi:hypothetical protein
MTTLREAVQEFVADWDNGGCGHFKYYAERFRGLLAQQAKPTVKESLQVPPSIADAMTAADLAWLETRRLVRVWEELGQMRWAGADEGWDKAIEKVRNRLDKECQDVLAWKGRVEASGETAVQLLQRMKHE